MDVRGGRKPIQIRVAPLTNLFPFFQRPDREMTVERREQQSTKLIFDMANFGGPE